MKKITDTFKSIEFKLFTTLIIILTLLTALVYIKGYVPTPIKADGKGYYLYLPAVFIHNDLTLDWTSQERIEDNRPADLSMEWYGTTEYEETGNILNKYTVGLAIIWIPFFLIADFLTILFQMERDGFGVFYHASIGFSGILAASTGAVLTYRLLRKYFTQNISLASSLIILFGTNLLHYATYDSTFTHSFSFAIFAGILLSTRKFYESFQYRYGAAIGILLGFAFLLRPTNALFVLPFLLYGIVSISSFKERISDWISNYKSLLVIFFSGLITSSPQFLYWKFITGHWLVFSYRGEYFDFTNPQLLNVLFSSQKGLFFYTPVLLLAVTGLFLLYKYAREYFLGALIYIPLSTYIISSWWAWQYGSSFGHRIFVDSYALFALGLGALLTFVSNKSKVVKYIVYAIIAIAVLLSLFNMLQYWQGDLPQEGTTLEQYFDVWKHQFGFSTNPR